MAARYKGVLFDMDGVVLDSAALWNHIIGSRQKKYALDMSVLQDSDGFNLTTEEAMTAVLKGMGIYSAEFLEKMLDETDIMYAEGLESLTSLEPGIADVLSLLKDRGVPAVLVSNSSRRQVEAVLDFYGLRGYFCGTVTSDDVRRGKPDPEPYAMALDLSGLSAGDALVVEDSPTGILSAENAGISHVLVSDDGVQDNSRTDCNSRGQAIGRYCVPRSGLHEFIDKVTER